MRDPRKDPIVGDILDIEGAGRLRVYRADFMIGIEDAEDPGLQWMITRSTWREMAKTAHVVHSAPVRWPDLMKDDESRRMVTGLEDAPGFE
jgi:hypothetical protein